ncbi:hypothetical protein LguiA_005809 [Lonicera macranthoides]
MDTISRLMGFAQLTDGPKLAVGTLSKVHFCPINLYLHHKRLQAFSSYKYEF